MASEILQVLCFKPFFKLCGSCGATCFKGGKASEKQFDHLMIDHDVDIDLLNVYFHVCPMTLMMVGLSGDEGDG